MADFAKLAKYAGAARGLRQSISDYRTLQANKQSMQQKKNIFDMDMKIKKAELDKAEMENTLAPERLKYERENLKLKNKALNNKADLAAINVKQKEAELKTKAVGQAASADFFGKVMKGEDINLPSGASIETKYGDLTLKYDNSKTDLRALMNNLETIGNIPGVDPQSVAKLAREALQGQGLQTSNLFGDFKDSSVQNRVNNVEQTSQPANQLPDSQPMQQQQATVVQPMNTQPQQRADEFVKTKFSTDEFGYEKGATFENVAAEKEKKKQAGLQEVKKQIAAQRGKLSEKQETNVDTAFLLLEQQAELLSNAFNKTAKNWPLLGKFGIDPKKGGLQGRFFGLITNIMGKTGYNEFAKTFAGNLNEVATAIAKISAPSAKVGPDLIKVFQQTLADLEGNIPEAISQLVVSGGTAHRNWVARAVDENTGERLFPTKSSQLEESKKFDKELKTAIESAFRANNLLPPDENNISEIDLLNQELEDIEQKLAELAGGSQ